MASLTPTQRTLRALRELGLECAIVEKWNNYGGAGLTVDGKHIPGKRTDLFNIIDVLALDPQRGVIGVQSCGSSFSEHLKKLTIEKAQESSNWLKTPGTVLELWGWRKVKVKKGGKALRWLPRIRIITLSDIENPLTE